MAISRSSCEPAQRPQLALNHANFYHGDTETRKKAQRLDFDIAGRRRFRVHRKTPSEVLLSGISPCLRTSCRRVSVVNFLAGMRGQFCHPPIAKRHTRMLTLLVRDSHPAGGAMNPSQLPMAWAWSNGPSFWRSCQSSSSERSAARVMSWQPFGPWVWRSVPLS